jgi:hypothetical protein
VSIPGTDPFDDPGEFLVGFTPPASVTYTDHSDPGVTMRVYRLRDRRRLGLEAHQERHDFSLEPSA